MVTWSLLFSCPWGSFHNLHPKTTNPSSHRFLVKLQFTIECGEAKTDKIPATNHNKALHCHQLMRNQSDNRKLLEARESANDQVANVFSFEFDWLREWRKYSEPITVKPKPSQITFDTIENCSNLPCSDWSADFAGFRFTTVAQSVLWFYRDRVEPWQQITTMLWF